MELAFAVGLFVMMFGAWCLLPGGKEVAADALEPELQPQIQETA
jgi:hypothetical protein